MAQSTKTYRVRLYNVHIDALNNIRSKYGIFPAKFIRLAVQEKIKRDFREYRAKGF